MLGSIAGYVTTDANSVYWAHITYVGQDGNLYDLQRRQGTSQWSYGTNITGTANVLVQAANRGGAGFPAVPNAVGNIGVSVVPGNFSGSTGQIIVYYGADENIHAIFPVGAGVYWAGTPGAEPPGGDDSPDDPDGSGPNYFGADPPDLDESFLDGPDVPGGGDMDDPVLLPSPPGWLDMIIGLPGSEAYEGYTLGRPPLSLYTDVDRSVTTVIFADPDSNLYAVDIYSGGIDVAAADPVNISSLADSDEVGTDASGLFWPGDGTGHVFTVTAAGGVEEFWTFAGEESTSWGAHDVLHEVKATFTSPHTPIAPPALAGSVTTAFVGQLGSQNTKNVTYVDAAGTSVYLCSHALGGTWEIAYVSEIATGPPGTHAGAHAPNLINLVAYASDRQHIIVTDNAGQIVDLWGSGGTWHWGTPNQPAQWPQPVAIGAPVNLPTGMSAFTFPNKTDSLVYIGSDGFIWELRLEQGQSELPWAGPGYATSIGLPWIAFNASVMAGALSGNPNYVPPAMNP